MYKPILIAAFICYIIGGLVDGEESQCDWSAALKGLRQQWPVVVSSYEYDSEVSSPQFVDIVSEGLRKYNDIDKSIEFIKNKLDSLYDVESSIVPREWYCFVGTKFTFDSAVDEYIKLKAGNAIIVLFRNNANLWGEEKGEKISIGKLESESLLQHSSECDMAPDVAKMATAEPEVIDEEELHEMRDTAVETVREAVKGAKNISDIVRSIRATFDKLHGDGWICVAGTKYTSNDFEFSEFIRIRMGDMIINLFRNKD